MWDPLQIEPKHLKMHKKPRTVRVELPRESLGVPLEITCTFPRSSTLI